MALKFWEAFNNVSTDHARQRPEVNNLPSITEDQWLDELVRRRLIGAVPPDADKSTAKMLRSRKRARLSKYRAELVAANRIACDGPVVWAVPKS
jgi:hypothetical protein